MHLSMIRRRWVVAVAAASVVLAACGGGQPTATPSPVTATPTPAVTTATPTPLVPTATPAPLVPTATPAALAPTATPAPLTPIATPTRVAPASTPTPLATPSPRTTAPTPTPKYGGRLSLRAIRPFTFDTFDAGALAAHYTIMNMMNQLIMPDPYTLETIIGDLAESFSLSADGRVYTFKLRQGVRWHDGIAFTPKDILYNVERARTPADPRKTYHKERFALLQSIDAPDQLTVRITLQRPSALFPPNIALSSFLMYPAHIPDLAEWANKPVGTGPYVFGQHTKDTRLSVNRNPAYFKPGLPYLDGLDFTVISDVTLAEAAFRTGRSVTTNNGYDENWFSFKIADLQKQFPDLEVRYYVPHRQELYFAQREPWTDKRVRQAFNLAFDRHLYVPLYRRGFQNLGEPLASFMLPTRFGGQWGLPASEMERLPGFRQAEKAQDIAAARRLLAEAGVDLSRRRVVLLGNQFFQNSAEAVQAVLRQTLGFEPSMEIEIDANPRLLNGNFDINVLVTPFQLDEPFDSMRSLIAGAGNLQNWVNPRVNALMAEQDVALNPARRKALMVELQQEAYDWAQPVPVVWTISAWGYRSSMVKHVPLVLNTGSPFFKWEEVWLNQ